jgi:hypothetical protein
MRNVRLTPAQRNGLAVLTAGDHAGQPVYESNQTSHTTAARLTVYWQTVRWALEHGYATTDRTPRGLRVILTPAGRDLARTVLGSGPGSVDAWVVRLGRGHARHFLRDGTDRLPCGRPAGTITERTDPRQVDLGRVHLDRHCEFALDVWRQQHAAASPTAT